jgi:hypothetical protein
MLAQNDTYPTVSKRLKNVVNIFTILVDIDKLQQEMDTLYPGSSEPRLSNFLHISIERGENFMIEIAERISRGERLKTSGKRFEIAYENFRESYYEYYEKKMAYIRPYLNDDVCGVIWGFI